MADKKGIQTGSSVVHVELGTRHTVVSVKNKIKVSGFKKAYTLEEFKDKFRKL